MPTLFTKIINGELPGRFVYRDDICVAFLTIAPLKPGHTLVVPIEEVDHWVDLPDETADHLFRVAKKIARAIQESYNPTKVGMIIAGLEVPHTHIHLSPIWELGDMNFANQNENADPAEMDEVMRTLQNAIGWTLEEG